MFGVKKFKIDRDLTIWIKRLNVLDFTGCDYVPLIFSYVAENPKHRVKNDIESNKDDIALILEKALVKIKSKNIDLQGFIDLCKENNNLLEIVYTYIYTWTFKKKIVSQALSMAI